jgi:hypothetical protein
VVVGMAAGSMLMVCPSSAASATGDPKLHGKGRTSMVTGPVVRLSIARCDAEQFDTLLAMMVESETALRPGIERMPGLLAFYSGADRSTLSFANTSLWDTLEHAHQLDRFQPMLDAGKRFMAAGARFERPIMNYPTLWQFGGKQD